MFNLPKLSSLSVSGKKVLVRADLDISEGDTFRLKSLTETLKYLIGKGSQVVIIGHKGRPSGVDEKLSLKSLAGPIGELVGSTVAFEGDGQIVLKENLRFNPGEESNSEEFAKELSVLGDYYINEAFADSHRNHASIVGLPKLLPHAAGLHLEIEVENLGKVLESPKKPTLLIISGVKEDKLEMIKRSRDIFDKVLVGGRLPEYLGEDYSDPKVIVAKLNPDKEDITINSVEAFEKEIAEAGTIVLAGVPGKYEEPGQTLGTERIFNSVANSSAFKVVGGGDSLAVVSKYNLSAKFDWISVGGGAMLEFLTKGTLPGIDALLT